jgi:transposase-like protein
VYHCEVILECDGPHCGRTTELLIKRSFTAVDIAALAYAFGWRDMLHGPTLCPECAQNAVASKLAADNMSAVVVKPNDGVKTPSCSDQELTRALLETGGNICQAALRLGLTESAVRKRVERKNLLPRRAGRPLMVSDEKIIEAVEKYSTSTVAARFLGISAASVRRRYQKYRTQPSVFDNTKHERNGHELNGKMVSQSSDNGSILRNAGNHLPDTEPAIAD